MELSDAPPWSGHSLLSHALIVYGSLEESPRHAFVVGGRQWSLGFRGKKTYSDYSDSNGAFGGFPPFLAVLLVASLCSVVQCSAV